ncbi:hypothetical protein [Ruegeria lacuscaerulensis]|uniref:hypothetical protein n=1 Tax=Ruegeria lacuscaerulensis TaxID=55218 RepID=UPI00147ADDB0|nr:hypothetical protein [Ruegeria lacuscaerulensis]
MAERVHLTETQMIEILNRLEMRFLERLALENEHKIFVKPHLASGEKPTRTGRRPRSQYVGQLHLSILEEDEAWFKKTAQANNLQYGKFFTCLRQIFERHG